MITTLPIQTCHSVLEHKVRIEAGKKRQISHYVTQIELLVGLHIPARMPGRLNTEFGMCLLSIAFPLGSNSPLSLLTISMSTSEINNRSQIHALFK